MQHPFVIELSENVLALGRRAATGALRIAAEHHLRLAFFEGGDLVYFVSDVPEEGLAQALTREGRLGNAETRAALALLERQVSRKRSLVALVLEAGLTTSERLSVWLVEHAFECFARALDSSDVTLRFAEGVRAEHPLPFRVQATTLVLEGVRRMRNEVAIRQAVGPLDFAVDPAPDHEARIQTLPLSFYDGLVASQITQPYVLADLVDLLGLPTLDVLRALLALRCVGVLAPFVPQKVLSDSGRLKTESGRLRIDTGRLRIDSGRLRADSGLLGPPEPADEDHEGAQGVALALDRIASSLELDPVAAPPAEETRASAPAPAPPVAKPSLPQPQRRRRGTTAQLNLLSSAYRQMAESEVRAGNIAAAVRYYEAALAQCPENVELVIGLAGLLANRPGGAALAEDLLRKACSDHPTSASPRIALAKVLKASGRHAQASELLDEARRVDPDDAELKAMAAPRPAGLFARLRAAAQDLTPGKASEVSSATDEDDGRVKKCRYCGATCRARAVACVRCGATL